MSLATVLAGNTLTQYQASLDSEEDGLAKLQDDIALLDAHLRLRLQEAGTGGGSDHVWARLKSLRDLMLAAEDETELAAAVSKTVSTITEGATDADTWKEVQRIIKRRSELAELELKLRAARIAGVSSQYANNERYTIIAELAVSGFTRFAITAKTGIPACTVTRYLRKLKELRRGRRLDVHSIIDASLTRLDGRRRWLHEKRVACLNSTDVAAQARAENGTDAQEYEMLKTVGILSVVGQSLVDEKTLIEAGQMTHEQVLKAHRERVGLLLAMGNSTEPPPID